MKLYKFQACDSVDESIQRISQYIQQPYIWASGVKEFNDPFEFKVAFQWPDKLEDTRKKYFLDNPDSTESEFLVWFETLTSNKKWHIAQTARSNLLSQFAVCCLSKKFNNLLLWSHYCASHTGFCVEYDFSKIDLRNLENFLAANDVDYTYDKECYNYFLDTDLEHIKKACFNKSDQWKYEQEYRLIFDCSGKIVLPEGTITRIFLGCRADNRLKKFIQKISDQNNIQFHQMIEDFSSFSLSSKKIEQGKQFSSSFF